MSCYYLDNFRSPSPIRIQTFKDEYIARPSELLIFSFDIYSIDSNEWDITNNPNSQPNIHAVLFKDNKFIEDRPTGYYIQNEMLLINNNGAHTLSIIAPDSAGSYTVYLDVVMGTLPPSINGNAIKLTVLEQY